MERREGAHRGLAGAAGLVLACAALGGCGSNAEGVKTQDPLVTFAPVVRFEPHERWYPMGARWFVDRSVLGWSANIICPDPQIAAGREVRAPAVSGLRPLRISGLGVGPPYRFSDTSSDCEPQGPKRHRANQHNRPYDNKDEIDTTEGFFLDLEDSARSGERKPRRAGKRLVVNGTPSYAEIAREKVDGEDGLVLSYWLLYGLHKAGRYGRRFWEATHEGDWERFDVLVKRDENEYQPFAVRYRWEGQRRQTHWDQLTLAGEGDTTHPVMRAERGTHQMRPAKPATCDACAEWDTWTTLEKLAEQPWEGYGGAWGEWGPTPADTGPLGPHGGPDPKNWQPG